MTILKSPNNLLSKKDSGKSINYWKSKLHGLEPLKLPKDPIGPLDDIGNFLKVDLPKNTIPIDKFNSSNGESSLLFTITSCLQVLLYRYCNQYDFCIGISMDNAFLKDFLWDNLSNIELNPLPIRNQTESGYSFDSVIKNSRKAFFEAIENSNVTFSELIDGVKNDLISDDFLNILCIIKKKQDTANNDKIKSPNGLSPKDLNPILVFEFEESNQYLNGSISYRSDVFGEDFIHRMMGHYLQLWDSIQLSPDSKVSELNILNPKEKSFLLTTLNDTAASLDESLTILDLFENQVNQNPDAFALEFEGNQLTYGQLDKKSNQLAHYLKGIGLNSEDPVPICLDRSLEMIIAIFGIIKAGGAYVPIDPYFPADRIDYMIEDTGANIVICSPETSKNFGEKINRLILDQDLVAIRELPTEKIPSSPLPQNLVYIIYTSGSTGKPKGAMVEHRNLVNFVNSLSKIVEYDSLSKQLSVTTYIFDAFCLELFVPLAVGAKVILVSKEVSMDGFKLAKTLDKHKPTHMQATASGWQLLLNAGWNNPEGIIMTTGGEAIGEETKNMLARTGTLWNLYGPTETTITSAFKKLEVHEKVTIGKPIDNTKIYILGQGDSLNPLGIPGELCISGKGVGRGYFNRPELTAQKFVPDPFSDENDAVMYHTGDLARWLPDGNIEYLGRLDDQVKIRGYRIELGEIESILQLYPSIKQAVVLAKESNQGDKRLAGYVVCNGSFDRDAVIAFLQSKLPDYMIPSLWMELKNLPLAFSGKVERKALREIKIEHIQNENYEAPESELQKHLAAIWQKTLGLEKVGIQDDFFALGGQSLLAMKVMATIRSETGIELSIREMFNFPTIRQLAEILASKNSGESELISIDISERPEIIPLSYNQQSLWFIHQLSGSIQYHIPLILKISGKLDLSALEEAFQTIVNRHEALRTLIREKDGVYFQILLDKDIWKLARMELKDPGLLNDEITKLIRIPFDLTKDHMVRACVITMAPDDHRLVITMHHISSDGWSSNIFKKELIEAYHSLAEGRQLTLPPLPVQYIDFALWQRNFLNSDAAQTKIDYWKAKLRNVSPLQLPTDFARPSIQSNHGDSFRFSIDNFMVSKLRELGQRHQSTLFMTLLAAFKTLLYRHSGQEDICVGTPVAGRGSTETENLIGFFVNTLALRSILNGNISFTELLKEIRANSIDAFEFQQIPFELVVESLGQERDLSRNPVFQVLFVLQNVSKIEASLDDALVTEETYEHFTSKFDMTFELTEVDSGIEGIVEYNTDLYRPETIERFVSHFIQLLKSIIENPSLNLGLLNIIPKEERSYLLETLNATEAEYPKNKTIVDLFEEQVERTPDAIALKYKETELSYIELNARSNQVANFLIKKFKIQPDDLVGIELERSEWMVIVILAIIKSGGAYVPIDPEFPEQRKKFIREDAKLKIVINQVELQGIKKVIKEGNYSNINPTSKISPENLMYVIYTSGSTGNPKGCMLEHRGLVNRLSWMQKSYALTEKDCILQKTTFTFDVSVWELFWWSLQGASVSILEPGGEKQPEKIFSNIKASQVTVLHFVPSMLGAFLEYLSSSIENRLKLSSLKQVYTSGEALQAEQVKRFKELLPDVSLMNLYGPTEASIDVSYYACEKADELSIPIGKPIDNTVLYVFNSTHHLVPYGSIGEICIGGVGLARGYINREELTREKFIENPYKPTERLYRTGDLGRWREDGNLEYLGRMDDQVKIRGYRIELGEIESVLHLHPSVKQAVVMARENGQGDKRLVGYIVCYGTFDKESVTEFLRSKLPEYMIPVLWLKLEKLPLTFSGKTDRKALPNITTDDIRTIEYTPPRTEIEIQLAALWQNLLGLEKVGIYDDFFELGGHSLLAMRTVAAIRKELGAEISIRDLFSTPTVAQLAQILLSRGGEHSNSVPLPVERPENIPLSYNQQSLWFIHQLEGSIQYHIPLILKIRGKPDLSALEKAFQTIVNRHEPLRTVIREKDGAYYQIVLTEDIWILDRMELKDPGLLNDEITKLIRIPFDLTKDHMVRACFITIAPDDHRLVITMHHIASDGWSSNILKKELIESYHSLAEGRRLTLSPLPVQYIDYAIWQRNFLNSDAARTKIDYWKAKLRNVSPLQLPTNFARQPVQSNHGNSFRFSMDNFMVSQLRELAQRHQSTLFMTLLAAFKTLLYRYSGQEDICVGTPVAGRENRETEDLIGFFVNTLALRSNLNGNMSFTELLKEIRATTLDAFEFQQIPFELVVESLGQERDLSRNPVFQVLFVLQNVPKNEVYLDDALVSEETYEHFTSKFDMTFELTEVEAGIEGIAEYSTDLYKPETIERFVSHFIHLLKSILENPTDQVGNLKILSEEQIIDLTESFIPSIQTYSNQKTILDLFHEQVEKSPDSIAVVFEGKKLNYSSLNKKSNQLANYLLHKNIQPDNLIPICLDRSLEMIIGILGILKAGGVYVPIDPAYPDERIGFVFSDTNANLILTTSELKPKLQKAKDLIILDEEWVEIEKMSGEEIQWGIRQNQLAYVIYTSGSTGKPKGVLIQHKGLLASTLARQTYYDYTGAVLLIPSFAFDSSVAVIFGALTTGGQLILCKSELIKSPHHIQELLKDTETILCVPSYYRFLQEEQLLLNTKLKNVILAGENLDQSLVKLHFDKTKNVKLFNEYGPTEGTVWASVAQILSPNEKVTIGKPIDYTKIYILNKDNQLNPINVPGELCISGQGVARGYLNNPELTLEKFVKNPFNNTGEEKMYKTGDLARWLPDGNIEYLGRIDDQVKLRGYRIELGEVEAVINKLNGIKESAVILREDIPGQKMLSAYVVLKDPTNSEFISQKPTLLKKELRSILPEYMVPSSIMILERLPLTSNLKIDKKRLPKPEEQAILYREPHTEIEKIISKIWCESLKKEKIDINADFFEIGGHSLLAVKVLSLIEKELGKKLPLNVIFKYPRIMDLAAYLEDIGTHESSANSLVPIKPNGSKPPLFIIHGVGSTVSIYFQLAKYIEDDQPIYGFQPKGLDGIEVPNQSVEEMAAFYISLMIKQYPSGPYCIAGYSFGGFVAFEMARQLKAMGKEVSKLILFDTSAYEDQAKLTLLKKIKLQLGKRLVNLGFAFKEPHGFYEQKSRSFKRKRDSILIKLKLKPEPETQKDHESIIKVVAKNNVKILKEYRLTRYEGDLHLFKVKNRSFYVEDIEFYGWAPLVNKVHNVHVSGHHDNIFKKPEIIKEMAEKIQIVLDEKSPK